MERYKNMKMTMDLQQTQKVKLYDTLCLRCHTPQKLNDDGHCTRCESLPRHTLARIEERTNDRQILLMVILIAAVLSAFGWAMQTLFGGVK